MLVPLSPPPGLNSDDTTFRAEGRWADGNNVRPYNGGMQTIGAYSAAITLPAGQSIGQIAVLGAPNAGIYTIVGTGNKLWAGSSLSAGSDISPVGLGAANVSWSFAAYGNTAICSPFDGKIYQYTFGGGAATVIAAAPVRNRIVLVARRQVLSFGCNEEVSTTWNGRCIRGSDIEDPTNWTTSSTNNAFEYILDDDGIIVAAKVIGDYIAVWTSTSLWLGTFLGDPGQTYQFEKVAGAPGTYNPDTACVNGQVATWLALDLRIWQWLPGSVPAPVPCPISSDFIDNIVDTDLAKILAVPHFEETWLFYADNRDGVTSTPSRYIAFNQQGQWFRGVMARDAVFSSGLATALAGAPGGFLAAKDNVVYTHDLLSGTAPSWSITSADMYLDNSQRRVMVRGVIPDFKDQAGDVSLTLYVRDRPQSTAVTKGPYTLTSTATKKDFRASGKVLAVKFSGSSYARLGKPLFDTVTLGER